MADLLQQTAAVPCFDTAFHATPPAAAYTCTLPREWNARWGLRRYGFHGLSRAYASRRAAELAGVSLSFRHQGAPAPRGTCATSSAAARRETGDWALAFDVFLTPRSARPARECAPSW